MDLYVYSDESGVFDKTHNEIFVYGGLIFLGKSQKESYSRRYLQAEKSIRAGKYSEGEELKASKVNNKEKGKLYRSMNDAIHFGVIINQKQVLDRIYQGKKDKQRYLDYAYKIGLKKVLLNLIQNSIIDKNDIDTIHVYNDEHSTATNGKYELREALEQELKSGTYNLCYSKFFPPVFDSMKGIELKFCDSKKVPLIRAADVVANKIYFMALNRKIGELKDIFLTTLP